MQKRGLASWISIGALCVAQQSFAQSESPKPAEPAPAPAPAPPPPPGYGYPPPPPGYYPVPVPYYVPVHEPPPPWKPGDPAPPGFHVDTRVDKDAIRTGVSLLATLWVFSVIGAAVLNKAEDPKAEDGDDIEPGDWSTLYWPVVGPFLTMKHVTSDEAGFSLLLLDGVGQSVGALAIVIGLVAREEYLVRNTAKPSVTVTPQVGSRQMGVGVTGAF